MQTSERGIAFLERHEGVVLKAYRDPVGVWTIGVGLTAASGVVVPKAGMTISRDEASRLLQAALNANYEPAVRAALPGAAQHEFDGAVSFHFNTGAIGRASWVQRWKVRDADGVRAALMLWVKAGGKVLAGLVQRRSEESNLVLHGIYRGAVPAPAVPGLARIVVPLTSVELGLVRAAFSRLGYDPGPDASGIGHEAILDFQDDHDLVVDGLVGRATLAALQREVDSRRRTLLPLAVLGAGGAETAVGLGADALGDALGQAAEALGPLTAAGGALRLAWLAFAYRDVLATRLAPAAPGLASLLRSF